jgi:hypothetical protein
MLKTKASGFLLTVSAAFILSVLVISCDDPKPANQNPAMNETKDSAEEARIKELQKIFFSIPSPVEMAALIKEKGYSFDKNVLSPTANVDKHTGEARQAINLGIYGADLSYSAIFDQKQVTMEYFASAQKLAKQMSVDGALTSELIERLDQNQENRDSLLAIVSEAYADLNGYLKENQRIEISALVVAGGWLEALYLSTIYSENNKDMVQRIAEQKYALTNLVDYYEKFGDRPNLREMKADLLALKEIYNASSEAKGKTSVSKDNSGTVVIGSTNNVSISPETLQKIATKAQELRKKYITA